MVKLIGRLSPLHTAPSNLGDAKLMHLLLIETGKGL